MAANAADRPCASGPNSHAVGAVRPLLSDKTLGVRREAATALGAMHSRSLGKLLLAAARGATRYSEYYRMIDGISQRLLAQRLKDLTEQDLLVREVIPTTPVQVRYRLSGRGKELLDSLVPLVRWGQKWDPDAPPHRPGGDAMAETAHDDADSPG